MYKVFIHIAYLYHEHVGQDVIFTDIQHLLNTLTVVVATPAPGTHRCSLNIPASLAVRK